MEPKTPDWIRLDDTREIKFFTRPQYWTLREWYPYVTREGEESESFSETYHPNLQSLLKHCLENDIGYAVDLTGVKHLLTVKTAELVSAAERIKPEILAHKTKVRKRQPTDE